MLLPCMAASVQHVAQSVEAGARLVELEHGVEQAALAATEADVLAAQAELDRTLRGNRREDVRADPADVDAGRRTCGDADARASKRNDLEGRHAVLR